MNESPESEPLEIPLPPEQGPPPKRGRGRPRKDAGTAATPPPPPRDRPGRKSVNEQRAAKVAAIYTQMGTALALGGGLIGAGATGAGMAMMDNAETLGKAWADWADTSSRVAKMIDGMAFGGGALAVMFAHAPIVKAIMSTPSQPDQAGGGILNLLRPVPHVADAG